MHNISPEEEHLVNLWQAFLAGNQQAYTDLVRNVYKLMFGYATKFTKDRELIKDCLQDLFTDLWYKRKTLNQIQYVKIYLLTCLRNNLIHKVKKTQKSYETEEYSEKLSITDGRNIEIETIWQELSRRQEQEIRLAIGLLSDRQQEVIFLKFYEGLSNEEISQIMGIGRQPVANLIHKAITHLKQTVAYKYFLSLLLLLTC